jgi:hypothetical protein
MKFISPLTLSLILSFFVFNLQAQLFEDFEAGSKSTYAPFAIELSTGEWMFDQALIGTLSSDKKNGLKSARIQAGFIEMEFDYPLGLSEVSFLRCQFQQRYWRCSTSKLF